MFPMGQTRLNYLKKIKTINMKILLFLLSLVLLGSCKKDSPKNLTTIEYSWYGLQYGTYTAEYTDPSGNQVKVNFTGTSFTKVVEWEDYDMIKHYPKNCLYFYLYPTTIGYDTPGNGYIKIAGIIEASFLNFRLKKGLYLEDYIHLLSCS